jgi:hypothetical protein
MKSQTAFLEAHHAQPKATLLPEARRLAFRFLGICSVESSAGFEHDDITACPTLTPPTSLLVDSAQWQHRYHNHNCLMMVKLEWGWFGYFGTSCGFLTHLRYLFLPSLLINFHIQVFSEQDN